MITLNKIMSLDKEEIPEIAQGLTGEELRFLVELLAEKDDKIRYPSLLLLQNRASQTNDVYPYWDIFRRKLESANSHQRSIGLLLLAENTKWDTDNRMDQTVDSFLEHVNDEKPITAR